MADSERRSVPREPVHFVAELELDGERVGCGVSRDASGAGLLLLTSVELALGRDLVLYLYIPGEAEPRRLSASVVRCDTIPLSEAAVWAYRVGLKFQEAPPDLQDIVRNMAKRGSKAPPPGTP